MAYRPYSGASSDISFFESQLKKQQGIKEQETKTQVLKGKMAEEFQESLEGAQEAAKKRAKKKGGLWKGLNILGAFLGPAGAAVTGALSGYGQAREQRKAMSLLLKQPKFKKFEGTFLGDFAKQQKSAAREAEKRAGASLVSGLVGGLSGFAGGKLLGGKGGKTGFFEGMFKGTPQAGAGAVAGADVMLANPGMRMGKLGKTPFKQLFQNVKGAFDPTQLQSRAAGILPGGKSGFGKVAQSAAMLPILAQMFGGGSGGTDIEDLIGMFSDESDK